MGEQGRLVAWTYALLSVFGPAIFLLEGPRLVGLTTLLVLVTRFTSADNSFPQRETQGLPCPEDILLGLGLGLNGGRGGAVVNLKFTRGYCPGSTSAERGSAPKLLLGYGNYMCTSAAYCIDLGPSLPALAFYYSRYRSCP